MAKRVPSPSSPASSESTKDLIYSRRRRRHPRANPVAPRHPPQSSMCRPPPPTPAASKRPRTGVMDEMATQEASARSQLVHLAPAADPHGSILGSGAFGRVTLHAEEGTHYAVKSIPHSIWKVHRALARHARKPQIPSPSILEPRSRQLHQKKDQT